jgi:hypothetical protein
MSNMTRVVAITLVLSFLTLNERTFANDQDALATPVPAPACEPQNQAQAAKVALSNAAWVFSGSSTGSVTFFCPVILNCITEAEADPPNNNTISSFRVYYRDSDATGNAARVTARLAFRGSSGRFFAGSEWDSNNPNAGSELTGNRTDIQPNQHGVQCDALYSFLVTLMRADPAQNPAFSGIDFPPPPPVP